MSNPSYNDLTSSINRNAANGRLTEEPGPTTRSIPTVNNGTRLSRGLSRDRDKRVHGQAAQNALSSGNEQHPGTAGSQGRRMPSSSQTSTGQILPSKRSALVKQSQQQLEYIPDASQNYASQRVGEQTMNSSNNYEQRQLPLIEKAATGTGSLSVLNQGLLSSASKQRTLHMKTSSLAKEPQGALKTELSMQDPQFNELRDNNMKFCAKSKSNINLQPQQQQASSEQTPVVLHQQLENNPNEMKLGTYSKYKIQMNGAKINGLHKRGSQSNHDTNNNFKQIEVSPTNVRQAGYTQTNMLNRSIDEHNTNKPSSKHFSTNPAAGPQGPADGHRKMSLAAKAGQMQIFNNINSQHLNHGAAAVVAPEDQQRQMGELPLPMNYNYAVKGKNPVQHHSSLPPQAQSSSNHHQPGAAHVNIPPPSSLQQAAIGPRQLESYLGRRQIIQQQREKKQELLKQLDLGRHNSQSLNPSTFSQHNTRNLQNATDGGGAGGGSTVDNGGQQLMVYNNQAINGSATAAQQSTSRPGGSVASVQGSAVGQNKVYSVQIKQIPSEQGYQQGVSPPRFQRGPPMPYGGNEGGQEMASARRKLNGLGYGAGEQNSMPSSTMNVGSVNGQGSRQGPSSIASGLVLASGKYRASDVNLQGSNSPHYDSSSTANPSAPGTVADMPGVSGVGLSLGTHQSSHHVHGQDQEDRLQREQQQQMKDTSNRNKDLQQINHQVSNQQAHPYALAGNRGPVSHHPENNNNVNSRITRKLEGGRPHKVYDYMFIQMSNEQFKGEYAGRKIIVQVQDRDREDEYNGSSPRKHGFQQGYQNTLDSNKYGKKFMSPNKSPGKMTGFPGQSPGQSGASNLNGLVKIRAYDSQVTDELPLMQCNLLPTQLDHVKLLICEQDDKNYPKLTPDAQNRFEIEKQNQIKQYMEDIIQKLQQKDRKFKVTVKKKFVDDALYNSTSIRVASVYVIVVNREKTYDPLLNQKFFRARKRTSDNLQQPESSEEDEDQENAARKDNMRRSANPNLMTHGKKRSMYDSDTNGGLQVDQMNSTSASSNIPQFKKLMFDKNTDSDKAYRSAKGRHNSNGPTFKRAAKKEDETTMGYRYHSPVKEYPAKYGPTKIRIIQDVKAHDHHRKHPINQFFNQYNEFMRLVFKNKNLTTQKFNANYAMGLARSLGLNLKKDAFSEQNLKSREHLNQMKEKLIFCFYRKIYEQNHKDNGDAAAGNQVQQGSDTGSTKNDNELDDSVGSALSNNKDNSATPKSKKSLALKQDVAQQEQPPNFSAMAQNNAVALPHPNVVYKYFIGKGNNSIMVRSLFKNRYWWVQNDKEEMEKCNFCWTQIKNNKLMEVLPCKFPNKKSGIKNNGVQKKQNTQLLATPQHKSNKKKKTGQQNSEKQGPEKRGAPALGDAASARFTEQKLYNKIEDNFHMNNKKALYLNMKNYYEALDQDVFANLPLTFHVKNGLDDPEFQRFEQYYAKCEEDVKNKKAMQRQRRKDERELREKAKDEDDTSPHTSPTKKPKEATDEPQYYQSLAAPKNIWIIKPGENTNRGQGIQVAKDFAEIKDIIIDSTQNRKRTCIVQKYIHNPLLIHRRKFDIRTFALMTSVNGTLKAYLYEEGYLRTSCREYSINNLNNKLVHLTNDAVQKRSEDYGKFEPGNKLSYNEFQVFLDKNYPDLNICFERDILPQMNKMTTDVFRACHGKLDPKRRLNCMEVFGLDFMICDEFRPYLIEVNTNPCLELSSPLLARLIPTMLENSFKIGLDGVFFPPEHFSSKKAFIGDACPENRYTLCFDDSDPNDGPYLDKVFATKDNIIIEMDEDELSEEEVHDDEE